MALDTAVKRASAINIGCPWRGILPIPDASIDLGDQQAVSFFYSGIDADEPAPIAAFADLRDMCKWLFNTFIERW